MKTSTAILIAAVGVVLSLCVGVIGGAVAGIYVSQLSGRTAAQGSSLPGSPSLSLPNQTQPNETQPDQTFPNFRNPNRGGGNYGVQGAVVIEVTSGSPAEKAGLLSGDIITTVNGQAVDATHPLNTIIQQAKPGDTLQVTVRRGGNNQNLTVTLGTNPDNASAPYLGIRFTMFSNQSKQPGSSG
ncbi:MAG: PDZ domain-containing protein [Anaerolineae bacterium]